jgi:GrpB-like predicted nucleotidyltransferase (UPF0157 family)
MVPLPTPVLLIPYDPEWPNLAKMHSAQLSVLGSVLVIVHHIGSTSVPGLAAKPIIDLMPLVTSLSDLDRERSRIETLGYRWHGELGMAGRRYCTLSDELGNRIVQLHFFAANSPHVTRHLAFRDYLRAHPEEMKAYEKEKQRARDLYPDDSHAYTDEKAAWIRAAEIKALRWLDLQQAEYPHSPS